MAVVEKFLGKRVDIPEDRRYDPKQGLWGQQVDRDILFGMTEPTLVLMGGVKDVDWLVLDGQTVNHGESVIFAITGKSCISMLLLRAVCGSITPFGKIQPSSAPTHMVRAGFSGYERKGK